jgi:type III restriction enzyme
LFGPQAAVETSFALEFDFSPPSYAPHWAYVGYPYQFQRHYYAAVGELKNAGEEYECAKALDRTHKVKHWVRNLERRGFWLPLANRKFYPDFVAELTDEPILALEHKGRVYATNDDSKEKCNVGDLWEQKSDGKALFLMTVVEQGKPGLFEQIAAKIG